MIYPLSSTLLEFQAVFCLQKRLPFLLNWQLSPVFLIRQLCFWRFSVNYLTVVCWFFSVENEKSPNNSNNWLAEKFQKHNWRTKKLSSWVESYFCPKKIQVWVCLEWFSCATGDFLLVGQKWTKKELSLKVAFSQKVLMCLSFLQTDKPNYFPELKFWFFFSF